jgi:hypothetical protein
MRSFALALLIAALVSLLTGYLGVVLSASLHILGWIVVALLVLGLVWTVFGREAAESRELRRAAKFRERLGYGDRVEPQQPVNWPTRQGENGPSTPLPENAEVRRVFATAVAAADQRLQRDEQQQREPRQQELADESARARRDALLAPVLDGVRALEAELKPMDSVRFDVSPEGDSAVIAASSPEAGTALVSRTMLRVASTLGKGPLKEVLMDSAIPDCLVIEATDDNAAPFILRVKRDQRWKAHSFGDAKEALAAITNALAEYVATERRGLGDK